MTSGTAFIPNDSHLAEGLHRLVINIENDDDGDPSVAVRAKPPLTDEDDDEGDPWFVSGVVKGIKCRTYDFEDEVWEREWEDTNSVPRLLEITLYMDPLEEFEEPVTLKRLIEIPVAPKVEEDEGGGA